MIYLVYMYDVCFNIITNDMLLPVVLVIQVKNKMPAPVQITAEQLLREAKERELELVPPVSTSHCGGSVI